jgi:hypothetical protein
MRFSIAEGYKLDGRGSICGRFKKFFFLKSVQTCSMALLSSYIIGTGSKATGP